MVCGQHAASPFLMDCADLYLGKRQRVDYYRCGACALVQQHPVPADVSAFYDAYPIHATKSRAYSWVRRQLLSGVYLPPQHWPAGAQLLDFGCGDGWYLEWCRDAGLSVVGFEHGADHARALGTRLGIPVLSNPDQLLAEHRGRFDVITLHFVVEHLTDPLGVFDLLGQLLKPGGRIRYAIPNIDSWEFKLFKRRWHSLDAPRHIQFMGVQHARLLADRLGLQCEVAQDVPFPNGFGGSLPTAVAGSFSAKVFLLTLPLSVAVTRLFPSGNRAYTLRRPA